MPRCLNVKNMLVIRLTLGLSSNKQRYIFGGLVRTHKIDLSWYVPISFRVLVCRAVIPQEEY